VSAEVRLNGDGATLTVGELEQFVKQVRKHGVDLDTMVHASIVEGVVRLSVPVVLTHRSLAQVPRQGVKDNVIGAGAKRRGKGT
jgi:hypothetical protein